MKRTFQPSNLVRARRHGFRHRMATVGGRKQVVKGLARRREAEKALFLSRATAAPAKPQAPPTPRKTAPTGKQVAVGGGIAAILAALAAKWQAVEAWFNGFLGG